MKILVADDAAFMRATLSDLLKHEGHEIAGEAENGKRAVKMYQTMNPDLVIMDITMPTMNGIEAIKAIKAFDETANIVVCSAIGQQKIVIEAIEVGAADFIVKPFNKQRVTDIIDSVLIK